MKTAVLIIDMQKYFLQQLPNKVKNELLAHQMHILAFCKKNKIPVIFAKLENDTVSIGAIDTVLMNATKDLVCTVVNKRNNSAFTNTDLDTKLKQNKVSRLLVMGLNANACIQDTVIAALKRGYKVLAAEEIMASTSRGDLLLSRRNKEWYIKNTQFFNDVTSLIQYLNK